MISVVNTYCQGYIVIPILEMCAKRRFFTLLNTEQPYADSFLIKKLGVNPKYFKLTLDILEASGWVNKNKNQHYLLSKSLNPSEISEDITEIYRLSFDELFTAHDGEKLIIKYIEKLINIWDPCLSPVSKLYEGALLLIILFGLKANSSYLKYPLLSNLSVPLREAIYRLFIHKQWMFQRGNEFILTKIGEQILNQVNETVTTVSYRLTLYNMQKWLFENFYGVSEVDNKKEKISQIVKYYNELIKKDLVLTPLKSIENTTFSDEQKRTLLIEWNNTQFSYPKEKCVHELFEEQVRKTPESVAVAYEDQFLTYRQLDQQSTVLAIYLQSQGVEPNQIVAIYMERSLDMIIGLLGVLKSGGCYVPLDPNYPQERLQYIVINSRAKFILTQAQFKEQVYFWLDNKKNTTDVEPNIITVVLEEEWQEIHQNTDKETKLKQEVKSHDLAYVIYTSGSTGNPKGVMIPHQALTNFLASMSNQPGLNDKDRLLAITTYCFDIAGLELYLPLINGAQCVICSSEKLIDASKLKQEIEKIKPSIMQATPTTWSMLFRVGWKNKEKIKILCGGERLPESLQKNFFDNNCEAWNMFGPTESTVWSTIKKIKKSEPISIGKPIANTQIYILDIDSKLLPVNVPGELCISGDGLALGYLNQPMLTKEKFIDHPFISGEKLYKTGDRARWLSDGNIEFLGRMDDQVKIRGFRIELSEIEKKLIEYPNIQDSVVVVKENKNDKWLIAWIVLKVSKSSIDIKNLKNFLKKKLPEYMIPLFFIPLKEIPLTPNGKVDRKALSDCDISEFQESGFIEQQFIKNNDQVKMDSGYSKGEKAISNFYSLSASKKQDGFQEVYLTFCPFPERIPGFSMTRVFLNPQKYPEEVNYILSKQVEMRQVLFCKENFNEIQDFFDIGCGHGTDVIQIAELYSHIKTHGFTLVKEEADIGNQIIARKKLQSQAEIFYKNSEKDEFPGFYDLIVGIEVSVHIQDKNKLFENVTSSLNRNGRFLIADFIANLRGPIIDSNLHINIPTQENWVNLLSKNQLVIDEIVDVSEQISNFNYDPDLEENIKGLPKIMQDTYRNYGNQSLAFEKGWISYCLFKLKKESGWEYSKLKEFNFNKLINPTPYPQALAEMIDLGKISYPKPDIKVLNQEAIKLKKTEKKRVTQDRKDNQKYPVHSLDNIKKVLLEILEEILVFSKEQIENIGNFKDLGLTSINAIELTEGVNKRFSLNLPTSIFFEFGSLDLLINYVLKSLSDSGLKVLEKNRQGSPFDLKKKIHSKSYKKLNRQEDVAIIGLSCRCAGANNANELWDLISQGQDAIKEITDPDWLDFFDSYSPIEVPKRHGRMVNAEYFDPLFFNISPKEAEVMDVSQRIVLEESYKALEDAGYNPFLLGGQQAGTFIGYIDVKGNTPLDYDFSHYSLLGSDTSILASRLAYYLDLKGPALAINTACSSSLVAIDLACQQLKNREINFAIAGGITVYRQPGAFISINNGGMLSPTGKCRPFDNDANGIVVGDGVGILILKRLKDAERDGDQIYGIIRGSGTNQDGQTSGVTVPSMLSQSQLEESIYLKNDINVEEIQYIETHGTATKLGDPIEIHALTDSFRKFTTKRNFCAIGSLKANVGHTTAAAGVLGVIKVLLSLKHQKIAPSINFSKANQHIDFEQSPFYLNQTLKEWGLNDKGSRLAAISSFGFSGTNAHLVLEEYAHKDTVINEERAVIIPLSAKTAEQLKNYSKALLRFIQKARAGNFPINLINMSYTLQVGRAAMSERLVAIVKSVDQLEEKLLEFLKNEKDISNFYVCSVNKNMSELSDSTIDSDIYNESYEELAEMWVKGVGFNWGKLYEGKHPHKISLPTYPFLKEYYGIGAKKNSASSNVGKCKAAEYLHPLLHSNTSTLREYQFSSTFSGNEVFWQSDQELGKKVLLSSAYLEMARAAVAQIVSDDYGNGFNIRLKNVVWLYPFVLTLQEKVLHIGLFPESNGNISYQIYSRRNDSESYVVHNRGIAEIHEYEKRDPLDLNYLQKRLNQNNTECMYTNGNETLIKLNVSSCLQKEQNQFILHPNILVSALQACMALGASNKSDIGASPQKLLKLEAVDILSVCHGQMWAWIRQSNDGAKDYVIPRLDIDLCDYQGHLCAQLKGLVLQNYEEISSISRPFETTSKLLCFEQVWEEKNLQQDMILTEIETIVCFLSCPIKQDQLLSAFKNISAKVQIIFIEESFHKKRESSQNQQILLHKPEVYVNALKKILSDYGHIDSLIYLWTLDDSHWIEDISPIPMILQGVHLSKVQVKKLILAGEFSNGLERCYLDSWIGFERSLGAVLPNTSVSVILQENNGQNASSISIAHWSQILWQELQSMKNSSVLYQNNQRYIQSIHSVDMKLWSDTSASDKFSFKEAGTYLITGGCGELGLIFAEHIAQQASPVNLILTGRSDLDRKQILAIKSLEAIGAEVFYLQGDISDEYAMEAGLLEAKQRFGAIHGVIHAAGIYEECSVLEKTLESFHAVMAPKVQGTLTLDKILEAEELEFICYFSSSSAILGDFGSCDYAVANRFQMAYGHYRTGFQNKCGKTIVINWPLWKNGGMGFSDPVQTDFYFKSSGQEPLETTEGLKIFDHILKQRGTQYLLLVGQRGRIHRFLDLNNTASKTDQLDSSAFINPSNRRDHMRGWNIPLCLEWDLKEQVYQLLQIPHEGIDLNTNLAEFGFDSISLADFADSLSRYYRVDITPALFFSHYTLEKLKNYFLEEYDQVLELFYGEKRHTKSFSSFAMTGYQPNHSQEKSQQCFQFLDKQLKSNISESIAIIGLSGRYPQASDVNEFWENIKIGKSNIVEIPNDRWSLEGFYHADKEEAIAQGKSYSKWGGFLEGVNQFDPEFFGISLNEAKIIDPQERLFLQTCWELFEDAGYTKERITVQHQGNVGVFAGVNKTDFGLYGFDLWQRGELPFSRPLFSSVVNRVSHTLNLNGPSMSIDTMCSSSLVAIHEACENLHQNTCDMAIAGGVNLFLHPFSYIELCSHRELSTDGQCKSFAQRGDGYVPAEGVGAVLLKPLSRAITDQDHIYGVIRATSVNHSGETMNYLVPDPKTQVKLIRKTLNRAGIDPRAVSYIEAHGTGTELGDQLEILALTEAFEEEAKATSSDLSDKQYCAIGSVKTNIGHCESAAGIAGLTKVLLQMKHGQLAPSLHAKKVNSHIGFEKTPFFLQKNLQSWEPSLMTVDGQVKKCPRIAGVSSFGAGGMNAHVLIEEYIADNQRMESTAMPSLNSVPAIVVLSAKTPDRLKAYAKKILDFIRKDKTDMTIDLMDLAYTLQVGRESMETRTGLLVYSIKELERQLEIFIDKKTDVDGICTNYTEFNNSKLDMFCDNDKLDNWVSNGDYKKILDFWLKGSHLDWNRLYKKDSFPKKISMPTYPFSKEVFWPTIRQAKIESLPNKNTLNIEEKVVKKKVFFNRESNMYADEGVEIFLRQIIAKQLNVPVEMVSTDVNYFDLGLSSLQLQKITHEIKNKINDDFSIADFFKYETIYELSCHLINEISIS